MREKQTHVHRQLKNKVSRIDDGGGLSIKK